MHSSGYLGLKADGLCHPYCLILGPLTNTFMLGLLDQLKLVLRMLCPPYNEQFVPIQTTRNKYSRTWEDFALDKALINCCIHMDKLRGKSTVSQELYMKRKETGLG